MKADFPKKTIAWIVAVILILCTAAFLVFVGPWVNSWGSGPADAALTSPGSSAISAAVNPSTRSVTIYTPAGDIVAWVVEQGESAYRSIPVVGEGRMITLAGRIAVAALGQ